MNNYDDEEKTVMTYIDPYTSAARTMEFSDNERWQDVLISFAEMINGDEYTTCGGWAIDIDVLRNFVEAAAEAANIKRQEEQPKAFNPFLPLEPPYSPPKWLLSDKLIG